MSETPRISETKVRSIITYTVDEAAQSQIDSQPELKMAQAGIPADFYYHPNQLYRFACLNGDLDLIYQNFTGRVRNPASIRQMSSELHEALMTLDLSHRIPAQDPNLFPLSKAWSKKLLNREAMLISNHRNGISVAEIIARTQEPDEDKAKSVFSPDMLVVDLASMEVVSNVEITKTRSVPKEKFRDGRRIIRDRSKDYIDDKLSYLDQAASEYPWLFSDNVSLDLAVLFDTKVFPHPDLVNDPYRASYSQREFLNYLNQFFQSFRPQSQPQAPTIAERQIPMRRKYFPENATSELGRLEHVFGLG